MASKDKESKASKSKAEKDEAPEFKYGVKDLAEKLGINEASVRVKLRNAGVKKAGKSYGWNTKSELSDVVDELEAEKPAKKSKDKPKKDEGKAKKADKGKSKKSKDEDDD